MKSILQIILVVGFTLSIFSSNVWGENFLKFSETVEGSVFYYDKVSVQYESGKVKLWIRINYGRDGLSKGKELLKNMSIEDYQKLSFSQILLELNCKEQTYSLLQIVYCDENSRVLYSDKFSSEDLNIIPTSNMNTLKSMVCR